MYLPACLSAYVGADITTALLAAGFYREGRVPRGRPACWWISAPTGKWPWRRTAGCSAVPRRRAPPLEGAGIHQGMMARTGAIYRVRLEG